MKDATDVAVKEKRPFSFRDEVGYAFGDMGGSFVNLFIDAFYLTFCVYVLGINSLFMGNVFLFVRLFDAFVDPLVGTFPDRWQLGKKGDHFKPYIIIFMFPLAISCVLAFMNVSGFGNVAKHVWVVFAYLLYSVSYSGTSVPFGAMANVITNVPEQRTRLSRARSIGGALIASVALAVVPLIVWDSNHHAKPMGFLLVAGAFAVLSLLSYTICLKLSQERIHALPQAKEKFNYGKILKDAVRNRPLIGVMVATVGSLLYITSNSQLGSIMYLEYYKQPSILSIGNIGQLVALFICLPTVPRLADKLGKQKAILYAVIINFAISLVQFLVPISNGIVFICIFMVANIGQMVFIMLIWALVGDCLDYHEYKFHYRSDGSLYAIYTFSRKIGSTLASALAGYVLAWIGFVSGAASQTVEVAANIRTLFTAVPVLTTALEIIGIGLIYNLNKAKIDEIYQALSAQDKALDNE